MRTSRRSGISCSPTSTRAAAGRKMQSAKPPRDEGWSAGVRADAALLVAAVCSLSACAARDPGSAPPRHEHVVVVTIDTLRADHLGCYGYDRAATPNIDRLAREGAMAIEATVPAPITRPSHVSIFTGLDPAQHGIRDNISRALAVDVPTLAEAFKSAGFDTAGFVSSIVLSAQSGLGRGFDEFSDRFDPGADAGDEARFLDILEKRGDVAVGDAIAWLERHAQARTFVWVHLYDPHAPYEPPEPYASRYPNQPYDGEVAWTDELVGRLDSALARLGIRDRTLTAVTSDHGEALGEHGERHNAVDEEPARARALGAALDRHLRSEDSASPARAAQSGDVPAELVEKLSALGYASGSAAASSSGADPKDKIEEYKVLNAVLHEGLTLLRDRDFAGAASRFRTLASRGIDSFESHYYYGQALVGLRRWRAAAGEFERAIPRLPGFAASYLMVAECDVAAKDSVAAIDALRRGVNAVPTDPRLPRRLGDLYRGGGDLEHALAAFRDAIGKDPSEASQWNSVGMILGANGELTEAERAFREAVQRDPREPRYTFNLGLTLEREHRAADAATYFRKTLELDPRFAAARERLDSLK